MMARPMTKQQIETALCRALNNFIEKDSHLLAADTSERSMCHRLAMHLAHEMRSYDVDCEYNRDGFDIKRLRLTSRGTTDNDQEAVTVFPDIIVHRRGENEHNLLVIEMKKASGRFGQDYDYDIEKLRAFRRELGYTFAVHVVIGYCHKGTLERKVVWIGD